MSKIEFLCLYITIMGLGMGIGSWITFLTNLDFGLFLSIATIFIGMVGGFFSYKNQT